MDKLENLDILQFHPAHAEVAELTEYEARNFARVPETFQKLSELNRKSTQAITIMHEGRIILMCGFITLWPGVCELWLIPTVYAKKFPILFSKAAKKFIEIMADTLKLHRMQALSVGDETHVKFMVFLGFEQEGILKQYSDIKEDFIQWGRLFPERNV